MPALTGNLIGISYDETECLAKPGVGNTLYIAKLSSLDLASWTVSGKEVTAIAMQTGEVFTVFEFESQTSVLSAEYSRDTGAYPYLISNIRYEGHSAARSLALDELVGGCKLVAIAEYASGQRRLLGLEDNGAGIKRSLVGGQIQRHLDTSGERGNQQNGDRDELDFSASHERTALYVPASLTIPIQSA